MISDIELVKNTIGGKLKVRTDDGYKTIALFIGINTKAFDEVKAICNKYKNKNAKRGGIIIEDN